MGGVLFLKMLLKVGSSIFFMIIRKKGRTMEVMSKKKKKQVASTATESIPYLAVYDNGIIEIESGVYSKSYRIPNVNFKTAGDRNQWLLAQQYSEFLGALGPEVTTQISLYNKTVDITKFQEEVLLEMQPDSLNEYREEYNEMLLEKMTGAKNNLETEKILTLTLHADGIDLAVERFNQFDGLILDQMKAMTKHDALPLTLEERLEILNTIYNQDSAMPLYQRATIEGREVEAFSIENCAKQGISSKDVIAPACIKFMDQHAVIGNTYAKSFYIANYPSWIKGTILTDFAQLPTNMIVSAYFNVIPQDEAIKLVKRQRVNISASIVDTQKSAARSGIDASLISPELTEVQGEANDLMAEITKDNGHLFSICIVITLFAPDLENLKNQETLLKSIATKNLVTIKPLSMLMEAGFNSSLPLGNKQIEINRVMTTNAVSAIIPFDVREVRQRGGLYYGLNAASRNMILYDRTTALNPSACILGMPGAGKSFAAKREITNILLGGAALGGSNHGGSIHDNQIYAIDPENEYGRLAEAFGGSVIKVAKGSNIYINPFDLNLENKDDNGDAVKIKTDFIENICEIAIGGRYGLSPMEISIIDRCVMNIYEPYLAHLHKTGKTFDTEAAPTMENFYNELLRQPQLEAQNLALSLERYVRTQDIFSHHTNVDINNRFVVFNIKDIGSGLKELGLQICLDHIWNKMIQNKAEGKRTWIYIDEFHNLMQTKTSAAYISQIWKRARKWNGIPTAITQNIEDMLKSEEARAIINNSSFTILLGQAPINKEQLSSLLNISKEEQKYISSAKPGMGLIRVDEDIIPMDDSFPRKTKLYKIMTTKPDES